MASPGPFDERDFELVRAVEEDNVPYALELIAEGANIEVVDRGRHVLHLAIMHDRGLIVTALIKHGVYVNRRGRQGQTPLMKACAYDRVPMINELIAAGANLDDEDHNGRTALWWAVSCNIPGPVAALIEARVDVNAANARGCTPLIWAARNHNLQIVTILCEAGADVTPYDEDGCNAELYWPEVRRIYNEVQQMRTPLCRAAVERNTELVTELIETGVNVTAEDCFGRNAEWYWPEVRRIDDAIRKQRKDEVQTNLEFHEHINQSEDPAVPFLPRELQILINENLYGGMKPGWLSLPGGGAAAGSFVHIRL